MTVQLRTSRMVGLDLAAPMTTRKFGEPAVPASEGKKHAQIAEEHQAWLDGQETTTRCIECPDWTFTGPASEARDAATAHREQLHPELVGRRTARRGRGSLTRGPKTPQQLADIEASKAARVERERVALEERIELTAKRVNKTGESAHADLHTHEQERPMPATRPSPTRDAILRALEEGALTIPRIIAVTGKTRGTIEQTVSKLRKDGLVQRVTPGVYALVGVAPATAPAPDPVPTPEPELPPAAEHAALVPVDAAPPGRISPLVGILAQAPREALEESSDWYQTAIARLEYEHGLVQQAIEAKAA